MLVNNPGWTKLAEIAHLADPDPWRNRCREAVLRRDRPALEHLADAVPIPQVSPRTLWLLGVTLIEVGGRDKATSLLKRAQHQYPTDLWVNVLLGSLSSTSAQWDDAVRFYSVALALRPQRAQLHLDLMYAFNKKGWNEKAMAQRKGAHEEELAEGSRAIDLDPKNAAAWAGRADAYHCLQQFDKAVADSSKAIDLDPKNAAAWASRGVTYEAIKQYDRALADYTEAIKLGLDWKRGLIHRGGLYYHKLHQYDKALADYSKIIEDIELNGKGGLYIYHERWVWSTRGEIYHRLRQYDKAVADLNKVLELDPKDWRALVARAAAYCGLKQYDKAFADLNKVIDGCPGMGSAWGGRGNAYADLKQYDKALADHTKSIELNPKAAGAWGNRGNAYSGLKQYDKALADYTKAIELNPKDAVAWHNRGDAYWGLKQYDKALAAYTRAIELDPKDAVSWSNRGNTYYRLRQYDKAIADYTKAIELDPKDANAWNGRGYAYFWLKQYDKAIADYTRAIELDPKNAVIWNNRGNAYFALKQYDKAVADYTRAIELDPKHPYAWANRGLAFASLRRRDKALADFSRAIEINPAAQLPWYYRALLRLQCDDPAGYRKDCAGMLQHFGPSAKPDDVNWTVWTCIQLPDGVDDWTKLVQWAEKALAADPNDFFRLTTLGAVLYRAGRFDEAVRRLTEAEAAFKKAKARVSTIAYTWLFLAMAEERRGHAEQAREWLARAVREIEQPPAERPNDPGVDTWCRRLALRLLRGEAEKLLKIDKKPEEKER
jgi:tetratricopeptide (TPR) repeat protein